MSFEDQPSDESHSIIGLDLLCIGPIETVPSDARSPLQATVSSVLTEEPNRELWLQTIGFNQNVYLGHGTITASDTFTATKETPYLRALNAFGEAVSNGDEDGDDWQASLAYLLHGVMTPSFMKYLIARQIED